jgi:putative ABC transport system permease protein
MIANLVESLLAGQQIMIVLSVTFAGIAFCGSMINASLVNLAERQREVATLLALGYSTWRIGRLMLLENLITSSVGTLLGLPLGYWMVWLTALAYDGDLVRLPIVAPDWVWIATVGLAALFTLLAQAVVQRKILNMNVVQALNVKE